jgi:hypothetical protein
MVAASVMDIGIGEEMVGVAQPSGRRRPEPGAI